MSVEVNDSRNVGRKLNLCTTDVLHILRAVYTSDRPLRPTDIARRAHGDDPGIKKFSNEFKIIKKLCPSFKESPETHYLAARRFLKVTLKPKIEKSLSEARREYKLAEQRMKEATPYGPFDSITTEESAEIKLIINRYEVAQKQLSEIEDKLEKRGRKDWRYGPILRGLLLYLYCECNLVLWKNDSKMWERRESNRYIRRVLSNPLVIQEAPFLLYWKEFNKYGFDVIDLLKQIATELYNQLHITTEQDKYLLRRATERYFIQLENHLYTILDEPSSVMSILKPGKVEEYHRLFELRNKFRELVNYMQRQWMAEQKKVLDFYENECNDFNFRKELDSLIETTNPIVINLRPLKHKYKIPEGFTSSILVGIIGPPDKTNYYEHNNKKYFITDPCLILDSKAQNLKLLLAEDINNKTIRRYSQASSLLTRNGIPEGCHSEFIQRLGFQIVPRNELGKFEPSDPLVMQQKSHLPTT
jgi:hypothetical protein